MSEFNSFSYGKEFETKVIEWLKDQGVEAVSSDKLYGEAAESIDSATLNKSRGDVLIVGTPHELDCKRGYFVAKNFDESHPFKGWLVLTNHEMDKSSTVVVYSGVIKKWISKRANEPNPKWDKSSIGNEGIKFDPSYRRLRAFISWDDFVKKVVNARKAV
jgi:hypothetical protein